MTYDILTNIPITFRLHRVDGSPKTDDIIKIYGNEEDGYSIVYFEGENEGSPNKYKTLEYMTGEEVDTYLESLLILLSNDFDPFYGLEIQAPGFPRILIPIPSLRRKSVKRAIFQALPLLTNFWRESK